MSGISVAVLAYNIFKTGRNQMFKETLTSIVTCGVDFDLTLVSNGSTDGTSQYVKDLGGIVYDSNSKMWYGWDLAMREAHRKAEENGREIIVFSADDIYYYPNWGVRLLDYWRSVPEDVKVTSLFLDPVWEWNTVISADDAGDTRYLVRETVGSASWTFRTEDYHLMLPVPQESPGEDHLLTARLKEQGYKIAQIELADHIGEEQSAWGNQSHLYATPLDRAKWGIDVHTSVR